MKGGVHVSEAMGWAKYIVSKCTNEGHPISNLQLQKILYYVQKKLLHSNEEAFDDAIEAWQFGPVVPDVYYHYCGYGSMPIAITYDEIDDLCVRKDTMDDIDDIIVEKRSLKPWDLVAETHKVNGAWDKTYDNGHGNHVVIPIEWIKAEG